MNKTDLYVIECRRGCLQPVPHGVCQGCMLDLTGEQPENVFGLRAITGITLDAMAEVILRINPNAVLTGSNITRWPKEIDPRWTARKKYW